MSKYNEYIGSYNMIEVEDGKKEKNELFIGKISGEYHLLGYRPTEWKAYFSENECTSLDIGKIILPEGKTSLRDLVEGDIINIIKEDGKPGEMNGSVFLRRK